MSKKEKVDPLHDGDYPLAAPLKRGRPSKLTKQIQDELVELLENGNYQTTAATVVGISRSTLSRWLQLGAEHQATGEDSIYRSFRTAIKKAEAAAEVAAVKCVVEAGATRWQASMTYLERKFPQRWSRGERREISAALEPASPPDMSMLTDVELQVAKQLAALTQRDHEHIDHPKVFVDVVEAWLAETREQIKTGKRREFHGDVKII
jgi:hypothetical protein